MRTATQPKITNQIKLLWDVNLDQGKDPFDVYWGQIILYAFSFLEIQLYSK